MPEVSRKVQDLEESQTLALTARARQLQNAGIHVISCTAGEPDFPTPRHVKDAALHAIEGDFTRYTPAEGIGELREAVAAKLERENGIRTTADHVLVSAGAKQSIFNALQVLCNPGDEVVIVAPFWVSYPALVHLVDARAIIVRTNAGNGFHPEPGSLRRVLSKKTRAVILNTPCNPTGTVYTAEELENLAEELRGTESLLISDEVYERVLYDGHRHVSIASLEAPRNKVITVNSVSKTYAMPGWRIGYMAGPYDIIRAAARAQSQMVTCINSVAQKAATAALTGPDTDVRAMVQEFQNRRDRLADALHAIPEIELRIPEGAMFFFLGISAYLGRSFRGQVMSSSTTLALYLLEECKVGLVPGQAFGDDHSLRLSLCCPVPDLLESARRIRQGLQQLTL
jgi:aspartate aminotransferase